MKKRTKIIVGVLGGMMLFGALTSNGDNRDEDSTTESASVSTVSVPTTTTPGSTFGPGSSRVFADIATESGCDELQGHHDRGYETSRRSGYVPTGPAFEGAQGARWSKVGIAYMAAANARMNELGCPGAY